MRGLIALLVVAGACLATACRKEAEPLAPNAVFVPVTLRSSIPGRVPWRTKAVLTNPGSAAAVVRLHRWPPDQRENETEDVTVEPRGSREIDMKIPDFPAISSLLASATTPFELRVSILPADGSRPPLEVPLVAASDLARVGDRLVVGPLVSTESERSHFAFTFPWTERDAVPFRVRVELTGVDGRELGRHEMALKGLPHAVEDPWTDFGIAEKVPLNVTVTLLGSTRGRSPRLGLWVYGIVQDRVSGVSRFVPTRLERGTGTRD